MNYTTTLCKPLRSGRFMIYTLPIPISPLISECDDETVAANRLLNRPNMYNSLYDTSFYFIDDYRLVSFPNDSLIFNDEVCIEASLKGNVSGCPWNISCLANSTWVIPHRMILRCYWKLTPCIIHEWCVSNLSSNVTYGVSTSFICPPMMNRIYCYFLISLNFSPKKGAQTGTHYLYVSNNLANYTCFEKTL